MTSSDKIHLLSYLLEVWTCILLYANLDLQHFWMLVNFCTKIFQCYVWFLLSSRTYYYYYHHHHQALNPIESYISIQFVPEQYYQLNKWLNVISNYFYPSFLGLYLPFQVPITSLSFFLIQNHFRQVSPILSSMGVTSNYLVYTILF